MNETGIVRRIDDLGRVVIPKEVRKITGLQDGDPVEILIDSNRVVLRKYQKYREDALVPTLSAIRSVIEERIRQDAKWGEQNHDPVFWLGILGEEFGELCQAVNETVFDNGPEERKKGGYANMRAEAVQVAAAAVAFVEYLDRKYGKG